MAQAEQAIRESLLQELSQSDDPFNAYVQSDDRPHSHPLNMVDNKDWSTRFLGIDGHRLEEVLSQHPAVEPVIHAPLCGIPGAKPSSRTSLKNF